MLDAQVLAQNSLNRIQDYFAVRRCPRSLAIGSGLHPIMRFHSRMYGTT